MARRSDSKCSCCKILLATGLLGAIGIGLGLYFGLITEDHVNDFVDKATDITDAVKAKWDDIINSDPFSGMDGSGAGTDPNQTSDIAWPSNGKGGLELELVNALDDRWDAFFQKAVADWDNGDPDALTLDTSTSDVDPSCKAIDGKMKVCNGDYTATGWRGINELVYNGSNQIISSVAKMNEYYLDDKSSEDEKQYTMCHEIGHGFGLLHTDENFMNAPLGDCLDYTSNPTPNLLPGLINYQKLEVMYGTVGSDNKRRTKRQLRSSVKVDEKAKENQERSSSSSGSSLSAAAMKKEHENINVNKIVIPAWVKDNFHEKKKLLDFTGGGTDGSGDRSIVSNTKNRDSSSSGSGGDWVLLHKRDLGEIHQIDLGGGYYGHVRVLLAE